MSMRWRGLFVLLGASALAVSLLPGRPAQAQEGEKIQSDRLRGLTAADLAFPLESTRKMLSGRTWLVTSGLDPVLGMGLGPAKEAPATSGVGVPRFQAGGGGAALVPYRDPSAKFSRNVLIPQDLGQSPFQTEPSIAVDPKDPDHLLVGMIDYNVGGMSTYTTIDGGATWKGPNQAKFPRTDLAVAGDPIVTFDRTGNAYYGFITLDVEEFVVGNIVGQAVVSSIALSRSTDGGTTWADPIVGSRSKVEVERLAGPDDRVRARVSEAFLDKPWMTLGPNPKDPTKDVIYVTYTKFIDRARLIYADELPFLAGETTETVIELVRSEDGGVTWSKAVEVSPRVGYTLVSATPQRQVVQGSSVVVAPDGTLYVAWFDSTSDDVFKGQGDIYVRRSDDAGVTWRRERRVTSFVEPGFQPRSSAFRYWSTVFPKLGVGPKGEVYLLFGSIPPTNPEDDGDIFLVSSSDKGETWSRRIRVNDDTTSRVQFFPELAVDSKGTLHAMWADMRDDPFEIRYHIYYTSSEDGGRTWSPNSRVTDYPTNPNKAFPGGRFIGDYFGIRATGEDVYMVWADGRLGAYGPTNQKIAFARKRLMPTPSILISPPVGPGGKDVVVQGFNFQPDRDTFIEVAGVAVATTRTGDEGRFSAQIFVPISGQGAHSVRAVDDSGNVASSSFFMDFGFDTIQKATTQLGDLNKRLEGEQQVKAALEELRAEVRDRQAITLWLVVAVAGISLVLVAVVGVWASLLRRSQR